MSVLYWSVLLLYWYLSFYNFSTHTLEITTSLGGWLFSIKIIKILKPMLKCSQHKHKLKTLTFVNQISIETL